MDRMSDRDFWEEFFNIYSLHPCLWNTKCKEYSNKHIRNEAYSKLAEKCKERFPRDDKDFVVKKFHSFRCCFRWELKRVSDSQKSGTSADDVFVPSLWYYVLLSFIADSEIPRRGKSNIDSHEETDDENTNEVSKHKCNNTLTAYFIHKLLFLLIPYYIL
jgi:hypothetical protein